MRAHFDALWRVPVPCHLRVIPLVSSTESVR